MITCKISQNNDLIPDTAQYFAAVAVRWGFSPKSETALCYILESALESRMIHLNEKNPYVTVCFTPKGRQAVISISDLGFPYIPSSNQKKLLSKGIIDGYNFEQLGSEGQKISFFITLDKILSKKDNVTPYKSVLLDDKISCRLTNPDDHDVLEAIRSIYSVWNYNYVHEEMYKIREYRNMLNSGKYISAMAENEHGQVLGHVALEEHDWFPSLPEICGLTVRPVGQGLHISDKLMEYICEVANNKHLKGLYGMPVTNHPRSQAGVIKLGFTPCGLYRHFSSAATADPLASGRNRAGDGITVNSLAVKLISDDRIHKLYLPQDCVSFVRRLFDEIDAKYELLTPASDISFGRPLISYQHDPVNRSLGIKIDNLGDDPESTLDWLKSQEGNGPIETVTVYVKMNDPSCPACYDYLTKKGYVFTGCLPGSSNGDYLIMLDLNITPIDKDKLDLHPRFKEMVDELLPNN